MIGSMLRAFFCIAFFAAASASAQLLPFEYTTTREGLLSTGISSIMQDARGYLWLASNEGLSRFDGQTFTHFRIGDGLPMNNLVGCIESSTHPGELWIGTYGSGLVRFAERRFHTLRFDSSFANNVITSIADDARGGVYCASLRGVYHVRRDGRFEPFVLPNGAAPGEYVLARRDDTLYVGWARSLFRCELRSGTVRRIDLPIANMRASLNSLLLDRAGTVWMGLRDSSVVAMHPGGRFDVRRLPRGSSRSIAMDSTGRLWIGTGDGLLSIPRERFASGEFVRYGSEHGLLGNATGALLVDRENTVWFQTIERGLGKLTQPTMLRFPIPNLSEAYNNSRAVIDARWHIWVPSGEGLREVWKNADGAWQYVSHPLRGNGDARSTSVVLAASGTLWVGTRTELRAYEIVPSGGASQLRPLRTLRTGAELPPAPCLFFVIDKRNRLFYSMPSIGVFVRDLNDPQRPAQLLTDTSGLPTRDIRCIQEDKDGNLWFGAVVGGLLRMRERDGVFSVARTYTRAQGLPDEQIRAIAGDEQGRLWIGTRYGGIAVLEHDRFRLVSTHQGLISNSIWGICAGSDGRMIVGTQAGLQRVDRRTLQPQRVSDVLYGLSVASVHAAAGDLVCFLTFDALHVVESAARGMGSADLPVVISRVLVNGTAREELTGLDLGTQENFIAIEYTALGLRDPKHTTFEYRLLPDDTSWDATPLRMVTLAALPSGSYAFEIRAISSDGLVSRVPARAVFSIAPPLWQRWWFVTLAFLALAGGVFLFALHRRRLVRDRERQQKEYARRLITEVEEERRRISIDLHDSIGQNLLLINNGLRHIAEGPHDPETVRAHMAELSDVAQQAIREVRDISASLHPHQLERLGITRALEVMIEKSAKSTTARFTASIDEIDGLLSRAQEISVFRIVQEGMTNIIKHARATEARIEVARGAGAIAISIRDNGCGFTPGRGRDAAGNSGIGIAGMCERIHMAGGSCEIISAPGEGASLRFTVPLSPSSGLS